MQSLLAPQLQCLQPAQHFKDTLMTAQINALIHQSSKPYIMPNDDDTLVSIVYDIVLLCYIAGLKLPKTEQGDACRVQLAHMEQLYVHISTVMRLKLECDKGCSYYKCLYHPETFQLDGITIPRTYTVDPDHVAKRLVIAVTNNGFGPFACIDAWKQMTEKFPGSLPGTWWTRDTQNVSLTRLFYSVQVEEKLKDMGFVNEVKFCTIIRNYFDVSFSLLFHI